MIDSGGWRCPLCGELADDPAAHLKAAHGVGGTRDRFGLRDAAGPKPPEHDADHSTPDEVRLNVPGSTSPGPRSPTSDRAVERGGQDLDGASEDGTAPDGVSTNGAQTGLPRPRPAPRRSLRRRTSPIPIEPVVEPARPAPLPADAAVLRLVCQDLDGVDAGRLQQRLADLPGIDSVTIDLYDRTADLFIDRRRAAPPHLVSLAMERIGLAVTAAELHRAPRPGERLGDDTRLFVIA